jgi:hypothetical protein
MIIKNITRKVPKETTLPDGIYVGTWGGYVIQFKHEGKEYECETEEGVRGTGFTVIITIKDGVATFETTKN